MLIPYRKKDKWGFCRSDKEIIIDCIYDEVALFHEDISIVERDKRKIIVTISGKEMFTDYDQISFFQEGFSRVGRGGKYTFINLNCEQLTDLIYERVDSFYEGMAKVKRNNKYGFIDTKGKEIISCVHDSAGRFENGIVWVEINSKFAFVNSIGKLIVPFIYINDEYASDSFRYNYTSFHFSEGRAKVFQRDSYEFLYSYLNTFDEGIKWGYIDNVGNQVTPFSFDVAVDFQEGAFQNVALKKGINLGN